MQPETKFKEKVLADLKKLPKCYVLKTQERARRGVLDLLLSVKGKFVAIELKTDDGSLDKLQAVIIDRIRLSGGIAFVTNPTEWPSHYEYLKGLK